VPTLLDFGPFAGNIITWPLRNLWPTTSSSLAPLFPFPSPGQLLFQHCFLVCFPCLGFWLETRWGRPPPELTDPLDLPCPPTLPPSPVSPALLSLHWPFPIGEGPRFNRVGGGGPVIPNLPPIDRAPAAPTACSGALPEGAGQRRWAAKGEGTPSHFSFF